MIKRNVVASSSAAIPLLTATAPAADSSGIGGVLVLLAGTAGEANGEGLGRRYEPVGAKGPKGPNGPVGNRVAELFRPPDGTGNG